jgi:hypothetical protein
MLTSKHVDEKREVVFQLESKQCPLRPENHGTERPLQKDLGILCVAFVAAARFLGGQLLLFTERQPALTVTESVSFGATLIAFCNSAEEEKIFPSICRAGK